MRHASRTSQRINYAAMLDPVDNEDEESLPASRTKPRATKPTSSARVKKPQAKSPPKSAPVGRGIAKRSATTNAPSSTSLNQIPRDDLLQIAERIKDKLQRWQFVAGLALAGGFGSPEASRSFLKHFWEKEARKLADSEEEILLGPFHTLAKLREAAKAGSYEGELPISSMSKEDLFNVVPQTVPPIIVAKARERLRRQQAARDYAAWMSDHPNDLEKHITLTRAKDEYRLKDEDFFGLSCQVARNPHYRSAAPMRLYDLADIVRVSYRKHGGKDGLERAREISAKRSQALSASRASAAERKAEQRKERREQLRAALAARGLELRSDSKLCAEYIEKGSKHYSLEQIVNIMHEMSFYFKHTNYRQYHQEEYEDYNAHYGRGAGSSFAEEISDNAKSSALREFVKRKGREYVLNMPDLPPTLRSRLEREKPPRAQQQQQQQVVAGGDAGGSMPMVM